MELRTDILSGKEIDPAQWDAFIRNSPQRSIYALHGYATAAKASWQAAIVSQNDTWLALMPFCQSRKWGLRAILQPLFTQYWGIFFAPPDRSGVEPQTILRTFLPICEKPHLFVINFPPIFDDSQFFADNDFEIRTRYTQVLDLSPQKDQLWASLNPSLRRQIKKGERNTYTCDIQDDIEDLLYLIRYNRINAHWIIDGSPATYDALIDISHYLLDTRQGWILAAKNKDGQLLAAGMWAHFEGRAIYLLGAYNPDYRNSGAMSWLMWQAIQKSRNEGNNIFDFEGSMIPGIEQFFRKFNSSYEAYFQIRKNQLPLPLRWIRA